MEAGVVFSLNSKLKINSLKGSILAKPYNIAFI